MLIIKVRILPILPRLSSLFLHEMGKEGWGDRGCIDNHQTGSYSSHRPDTALDYNRLQVDQCPIVPLLRLISNWQRLTFASILMRITNKN